MESPTSSLGKAKPLVREIVAEPPADMVGGTETGSAGSLNGAATVRILVVEDNPKMSLAVEKGLTAQGYAVDAVDRSKKPSAVRILQIKDAALIGVCGR